MKMAGVILYTLFHVRFSIDVIGFIKGSAHNDLTLALIIYGFFLIASYVLVFWSIMRKK
jgi:hypothetical protein